MAYIPELSAADIADPKTTAQAAGLVTALRLSYDYDWAQGKSTKALLMEAPDAIERYGRTEVGFAADWVHLPRLAYAIATKRLQWLARPQWGMTFGVPWRLGLTLTPGQELSIHHPRLPVQGRVLLADVQLDWSRASATVECWAPAGPVPRIILAKSAEQFTPISPNGVSVIYRDGVATLTILDETGKPLTGAKVTLDNAQTRITDATGRVQFTTPRGKHTILVQASGYAAMQAEIVI